MALLCLVLNGSTLEENRRLLKEIDTTVDVAELRADCLDPDQLAGLSSFPETAGLPVILTLRSTAEGGGFSGTDEEKVSIISKALEGEYAYCDLEGAFPLPELEELCRTQGIQVIRSFHNFECVPDDLAAILDDLGKEGSAIPKIAVMPHSSADMLRLMKVVQDSSVGKKIVIAMGEWGIPSRIAPEAWGSFLSFCTARDNPSAPGQLTADTLQRLYNFSAIDGETEIFGIIGNPVLHSRSPALHNPAFQFHGSNRVYIPFPVDDPVQFFELAEMLNIRGFSVTVPHKQKVIPLLDHPSPEVGAIGSCNTVVRKDDGWHGYNTDAAGFWIPLERVIRDTGRNVRGAVIIGAGGAARAVAYILHSRGIRCLVLNRTVEKARKLAEPFGFSWAGLDDMEALRAEGFRDCVIQTTKAGMSPNENEDPCSRFTFTGREIVYDIVYVPRETRFLKRAAAAGCITVTGDAMLREQGYAQYLLFTGREYPDYLKTIS